MCETDRRQNEQPATPAEIASAKLRSVNLGVENSWEKCEAALSINFRREDDHETRQAALTTIAEEINRTYGAILGVMLRDPITMRTGRPEKPMVEYDEDGGVHFYVGSYTNGEYGDCYE